MSFPAYPDYKNSGVEWANELPAHWKTVALRWVSRIYAGGTPDKSKPYYWENGSIPWLNSGAVNQVLISEPSSYITIEAFNSSSASWIPAGSLVIALAGQGKTKGMVAQLAIKTTCNQSMAAIVPDLPVVSRYLFWWLSSNYQNIRNMAGGDLRDGLNLELIGNIAALMPTEAEQTQIARFLDHETARIDALIEEQQRLIELLKEKRQAVISHAVTKGLDPTVPMKDSGVEWLGEVPAHWEVLQFRRGFTFLTDYEANGSFAATKEMVNLDEGEPYAWFVRATDLENGRIGLIQGNRYCDEASYQFLSKTKLDGGELLIAKRGEIGKVYQLPELSCRATLAPNLYSIKLSKKIITQFAFYWFSSSFGRPQLELANKSTTIGALYKDDVRALICIFPPVSEQHEITKRVDEQIRHVDLMIAEAEKIISLSSERRSALISAAVTGKIDVRGWQPPASTQAPESAVAEAN